jgi:hypothetical protein
MRFSPTYMQARPADYPAKLPWPSMDEITDGLAAMSKLKFPCAPTLSPFEDKLTLRRAFVSPILYPSQPPPLPESLRQLAPILSRAHPAHSNMVCATLHPSDPSCLRAQGRFYAHALPRLARLFAALLGAMSLLRYKAFAKAPIAALDGLGKNVLRLSAFVGGAIGTSWGAVCAFQALLPATALPTQRWFLGGFLAGMWGFTVKDSGRSQFLYCLRASAESSWRVGQKRGWWRGVRGGDLAVIVAGLAVVNALVDREGDGVLRSNMLGSGVRFLKGAEAPAAHKDDKKDE